MKRERMIIGAAWRERSWTIELLPRTAAAWGLIVLATGAWSVVATSLLLTRTAAFHQAIRLEAERAGHYEERIAIAEERLAFQDVEAADVKAQLLKLQEQERAAEGTLDGRLRALASKQAEVERRHDVLNRFLALQPDAPKQRALLTPDAGEPEKAAAWVDYLSRRLTAIDAEQIGVVNGVEEQALRNAQKLTELFIEIGVKPPASAKAARVAMGGPFVALSGGASSFESGLARAKRAANGLDVFRQRARRLPIGRPLGAGHVVTSGFGARSDPFHRRPAMHTGLDFKAFHGQPVYATAGGTVIKAGYSGGYGRMVVIDHGDGLATRYAHLSSISVKVGRVVKPGEPIGRAGSTGRSTATHLHYETRIAGEAVNPVRFLKAREKILPLLN